MDGFLLFMAFFMGLWVVGEYVIKFCARLWANEFGRSERIVTARYDMLKEEARTRGNVQLQREQLAHEERMAKLRPASSPLPKYDMDEAQRRFVTNCIKILASGLSAEEMQAKIDEEK